MKICKDVLNEDFKKVSLDSENSKTSVLSSNKQQIVGFIIENDFNTK